MKIDGACHCGKIAFEAEIDPAKVVVCHCTDCQIQSGSAFRTIVMSPEENFTLLSGEPKTYIKTTADSGRERALTFCADCGSPIYATSVGDGPKVYGIRAGTVRQRDQLVPAMQIFHRSALSWLSEIKTDTTLETT